MKHVFSFSCFLLVFTLCHSLQVMAITTVVTSQNTTVGTGNFDIVGILPGVSVDVSSNSSASGVNLLQGSSVTNYGTIQTSTAPTSLVYGIYVPGSSNSNSWGKVINYGTVNGYFGIFTPCVVNYGTVNGIGSLNGIGSGGIVAGNQLINASQSLWDSLSNRQVSVYNYGAITAGALAVQLSGSWAGNATIDSLHITSLGRQGVFYNSSSASIAANGMALAVQNTDGINDGLIKSGRVAVFLDMGSSLVNNGRIESNVDALKVSSVPGGSFAVAMGQSPSQSLPVMTNTLINKPGGIIVGNVGKDTSISYPAGTRDGNNVVINQGRIEGSIKMGNGDDTVTLANASTVTGDVDGGGGANILNLDTGATVGGSVANFQTLNMTGSGPVNLSGNVNVGNLNIANGSSNALSGNVTGNINVNSSDLNLTGTLNGNLTDYSGTTKVNGTVNGVVTVQGGSAVLGGSGTINGQLNVNQGTLSPGNSPGTLSVVGPATLAASSTYLAEVTPEGISDRLATTGITTINGASLIVSPYKGYYRTGQSFAIVTAGGGVSGSFGTVSSNVYSPVLNFVPIYSSNAVNLVVMRNSYSTFAANGRQAAAGRGLDSAASSAFGDGAAMFTALDWSTPGQINASLATMTPEPYQNFADVLMSGRSMMRSTISDRFTSTGIGPFSAVSASNTPSMTPVMMAQPGNSASDANSPAYSHSPSFAAFIKPFGVFANQSGTSNRTGYSSDTWGLLAGGDWLTNEHVSFGPHFAYTYAQLKTKGASSGSGTIESVVPGVHGTFTTGALRIDASIDLGFDWYRASFNRQVPGYSRSANASFAGTSYDGYLGGSYDFTFGGFKVGPVASVEYMNVYQSGFTETGAGSSGLKVKGRNTDSLKTDIGLQAGYAHEFNSTKISYDVRGQWGHEFLQGNDTISASFRGIANSGFSTKITERGRDSLLASAGVNAAMNDRFGLNVRYSGEFFRQGYDAHAVSAGFAYKF